MVFGLHLWHIDSENSEHDIEGSHVVKFIQCQSKYQWSAEDLGCWTTRGDPMHLARLNLGSNKGCQCQIARAGPKTGWTIWQRRICQTIHLCNGNISFMQQLYMEISKVSWSSSQFWQGLHKVKHLFQWGAIYILRTRNTEW